MFFTLSGFLITRLLLQEHNTNGTIDLKSFWWRRSRRLLPAALVCLAVVSALADGIGRELVAAVMYIANWQQIATQSDYTSLFDAHPILVHFWSLAVEEQFYIFWPLVVWVALRKFGHARGTNVALFAGLVVAVLGYLGAGGDTQRVYLGTDTRAAEILVGAALAVAFDRPLVESMLRRHVRIVPPVVALCALAIAVAVSTTSSGWVYRGGLVMFAVGTAAVIAGIVNYGPVSQVFELSWLRGCGKISYGLYLYHWPAFVIIGTESFPRLALSLTVAVVAAVLSYVVIEMPVRTGRVSGVILPSALVLVSVALVAFPGRPGLAALKDSFNETPVNCYYVDTCVPTDLTMVEKPLALSENRPVRVLVFGDSVAQATAWGLIHSHAGVEGQLEVISMGVGACPLVGSSYRWIAETRGNWTKYCDIDAVLDAVAAYQPDAVVAVFTLANQADLRLDGKWSSLERPEMRAALLDRMGDVAKATQVSGSVLLWSSVPRMTSAGGLFTMADGRVVAHNEVVDEFLRTHPEVVRFPLAEEYRTLTADSFRDGIHLSKEAAISQADIWQVQRILDALGPTHKLG
jgi:peptidoglycan/LPS O-acetylase OafA/YrhL